MRDEREMKTGTEGEYEGDKMEHAGKDKLRQRQEENPSNKGRRGTKGGS